MWAKMKVNEAEIVFAVGFPRSGTTFLATQMGKLAGCAATPETRFLAEMIDEKCVFRFSEREDRLYREMSTLQRLRDLKIDLATVAHPNSQTQVDRRTLFNNLLQHFASEHSAEYVVEKSPVHAYYLPQLLKWYPQARIVAIIRDGRDALLSLKATPWDSKPTWEHAADWVYRNRAIQKAARQHPERVHIIRFENLVADSDTVLADLANWLGINEEAQSSANSAAVTVPDWEMAWKSKATSSADPNRQAVWKTTEHVDAVHQFENVAGAALATFGYPSARGTLSGLILRETYPLRRVAKRSIRKALILAGFSKSISSQRGLERRLSTDSNRTD